MSFVVLTVGALSILGPSLRHTWRGLDDQASRVKPLPHRGHGWSIGALENTRELHAFGQWCLVWTRIVPPVDDGTEPWVEGDDFCSEPEGEAKGGVSQ